MEFVQVVEEEGDEAMELPTEEDGTLLQTTLQAQYPGSCGLKYRSDENRPARGVRLSEGRFFPPTDDGWGDQVYFCVFPKETKRKSDLKLDNFSAKTKRVEVSKCTDLIVLGLPWKTTEDDLREHFEEFGDVVMVQIKKDTNSGQSKGFGFVRFADLDAQRRVVATRHSIGGRICEVKIPNSKGMMYQMSSKIFVGRCTENITANDLREYFSKFGEVTDVYIPKPFRSFSFVTFLDPEVAQSLCDEDHIIKGVSLNVSNAAPKTPKMNNSGNDGGNNFNRYGGNSNNNNGYGNNMNGFGGGGGGGNGRGNFNNGGMKGNGMGFRGNQGFNNSQQQRNGGWNNQNPGNMDMPNLQGLGLNLQGQNSSNQAPNQNNPLGALVAAALGQFIGNFQNQSQDQLQS